MDIRLKECFGQIPPRLANPDLRVMSTSSLDIIKFVQEMYAHLDENKAFHQYQDFCLDADVVAAPWIPANHLDTMIGQAFKTTEKHCSKQPRPPWSENCITRACEYATEKSFSPNDAPGSRRQQCCGFSSQRSGGGKTAPTIPRSIRILKNDSTAAQRALHRVRRHAVKEREIFLQELKARLALRMSSQSTDVDAAIKTIDRQLAEGRRFRRIARIVKPNTPAALTKVEIVTTQSHLHPHTGQVVDSKTVKLVDTRRTLEEAIIARNKNHFAQADGTLFTRPPLSRIGSSNGYSLYQDAAGRNINVPEDSFVETHTVMELLRERHKAQILSWSKIVSFEEFITGFLHWNEQTSTSPSGRHLGLYGALVAAYCNSLQRRVHRPIRYL
jgi:hypothetical protein